MSFKRLIVITGASRGIGEALSIEANKRFHENTLFVLIARDLSKLEKVKLNLKSSSNKFILIKIDFSNELNATNYYRQTLETSLNEIELKEIEELIVIYNHGTLIISPVEKSADQVKSFYEINVFSVWKFLAAIREMFPVNLITHQYHVNISSLLATSFSPSMSAYSSSRSARATLFSCLALEQPQLRVLNYQPGPVYTDMLTDVYNGNVMTPEFKESYENEKLVKPSETAEKLFNIIQEDKFKSGCSIDYYD